MAAGKLVMVYNKKSRITQKKRRGRPPKKGQPTVKAVEKKVEKVSKKLNKISSGIEKQIRRVEFSQSLTGSTSTNFDGQIFVINPNLVSNDPKAIVIGKGTNEGTRTGNSVHTEYNSFKFIAYLKPQDATTNTNPHPIILKYWIVSVRGGTNAKTTLDLENLLKTRFFQAGSNAYQGINDTPFDLMRPINSDVFNIHEVKEYKLGNSEYWISSGGAPTNYQHYSNNDFKLYAADSINLTPYTSKNVKWNDDDTEIFNSQKWLFFTLNYLDGAPVGNNIPVEIFVDRTYKYTDM